MQEWHVQRPKRTEINFHKHQSEVASHRFFWLTSQPSRLQKQSSKRQPSYNTDHTNITWTVALMFQKVTNQYANLQQWTVPPILPLTTDLRYHINHYHCTLCLRSLQVLRWNTCNSPWSQHVCRALITGSKITQKHHHITKNRIHFIKTESKPLEVRCVKHFLHKTNSIQLEPDAQQAALL